jgi:hypothetical protein
MNIQQIKLLQRIQEFEVDDSDSNFLFRQRLARENGWTTRYTQKVIDEYKKFIFLAIVAEHPVTPSDQVDQVWHLHLSYSRSYWDEFCFKVLQQPLHHQPARGLIEDRKNFSRWYSETLMSYAKLFQQEPPSDIWPSLQNRFSKDTSFKRVNSQQNWIVPKPSFSLPQLPSLYLPRMPMMKLMAITLLFFIVALVSMSLISQIKEIAALQVASDSQPLPSQATLKKQSSENIISNPKHIQKSNSKQLSQLISWTPWIVFLVLSTISSLGGNSSYSSGKNDSDSGGNNSGCSGCGCM